MQQALDNLYKLKQRFKTNIEFLCNGVIPSNIAIACSGGSDSMALVCLIKQWIQENAPSCKLVILTVNHDLGLESVLEISWLKQNIPAFDIPHIILEWDHCKLTHSIQSKARQARYHLLLDHCRKNNIAYLAFGHQAQEQAETQVIRLLHHSHLKGLAGMSAKNKLSDITIIRPLLNIDKSELQNYLVQLKIQWFTDPTNERDCYFRNRIRQAKVSLPVKWTEQIQRYRCVEEKWITNKIADIAMLSPLGYWYGSLTKLQQLTSEFMEIIMERLLMQISCKQYPVRLQSIKRLCHSIINCQRQRYNINGYIFEKKGTNFYIRRAEGEVNHVVEKYNGGIIIFDQRWHLQLAYDNKVYIIQKLGVKGWQQLTAQWPDIKKTAIPKAIFMALPWIWKNGILQKQDIFVEQIILAFNITAPILKFYPTYMISEFIVLPN